LQLQYCLNVAPKGPSHVKISYKFLQAYGKRRTRNVLTVYFKTDYGDTNNQNNIAIPNILLKFL